MYIKQIANTLRTFGECSLNTHEIECEHPANSPRPPRNWLRTPRQFPTSTTKLVANTPSIPHVHHEIGCEHPVNSPRPPTKLVANTPSIPHVHHEIGCETLRQFPTSTHEIGCEHSVRRRGPIHRARILTLPIAHIRITKYVYIRYQICISTLSITCFHLTPHISLYYHTNIFVFLLSIILNIKQPYTAYICT